MNILNFCKFKKKIGQNYLIFNLKFSLDLCSGYNYFNNFCNEIDYYKIKYTKNNIYFCKKKCIYSNFLNFNFFLNKFININISFNIIKIFLKKINKISIFYFKIIIDLSKKKFFKKNSIIIKIKIFKKKFFFPYPKIRIIKMYFKKKYFYKKKFVLNFNNLRFNYSKPIKLINNNVFFKKI
ncbi:hypothetical protein [Candidatus Carsonella ruddii]|uniref:Ribosomal protein L25 n=1 Tax=Candidatus Carsonella ruddii (Diaphorina cf. continua) TaxID=2661587 RepID=A0A7R6VZE1_CARRU|nr:hypothetical protein [Candidatus Carsonella ruddii (Diaphorina cf. continua)]BCG49284.1 hypothetical protein CRDco_0640 [Candidatus Carsonella ruddii (Diaphorina cf. continua)]